MAVRFKLNQAGVDDLVQSAGADRALEMVAGVIKRRVEDEAAGFARTRAYSRSIRTTRAAPTLEGNQITVYSEDPFAHLIEWGSVKNPAYAPLRRAVTGIGMRFNEASR